MRLWDCKKKVNWEEKIGEWCVGKCLMERWEVLQLAANQLICTFDQQFAWVQSPDSIFRFLFLLFEELGCWTRASWHFAQRGNGSPGWCKRHLDISPQPPSSSPMFSVKYCIAHKLLLTCLTSRGEDRERNSKYLMPEASEVVPNNAPQWCQVAP